MQRSNEARVGLVVIAALVLALVGYFFLRGLAPGADKYYVLVNGSANVTTGDDVRLQGVKIGKVQEVSLDPNTQKPLITLAVDHSKLLTNYEYTIRTSSLVGEPYVDIRGTYNPSRSAYTPNDRSQVINGRSLADITEVTDQASNILTKDFGTTLKKLNVTIDRINKGVLSYPNQVKLTQALDGVTRLTEQASKSFGSQGVRIGFGDPGAQANLNRTLQNAALASEQANVAARNITAMTHDFGGLVADNRQELHSLLTNLNSTAHNVSGLTESLNYVVRQSGLQENAQLAFRSLRRAAENVEAGTAGLKAVGGDPKTQQNLRDTVDALRITTESLRDTAVTIKTALGDPTTQAGLRGTLVNLGATASNIEKTTSNLNDITSSFRDVFTDKRVQQNLRETTDNLNGTLAATRSAAERINGLLGGHKPRREDVSDDTNASPAQTGTAGDATAGTADTTGTGKKKKKKHGKAEQISELPSGLSFTARGLYDFSGAPRHGSGVDGHYFGDLNMDAGLFGSPFRLGISSIGDGSNLTLQTGTYLGSDGAVRYGVYRSKLGAGAEYHLGRFSLEGNAWDPNHASANVYAGFQITHQLEILAGRENIGGVHANSIGVRLRP